jgi:hypothetical protein
MLLRQASPVPVTYKMADGSRPATKAKLVRIWIRTCNVPDSTSSSTAVTGRPLEQHEIVVTQREDLVGCRRPDRDRRRNRVGQGHGGPADRRHRRDAPVAVTGRRLQRRRDYGSGLAVDGRLNPIPSSGPHKHAQRREPSGVGEGLESRPEGREQVVRVGGRLAAKRFAAQTQFRLARNPGRNLDSLAAYCRRIIDSGH